MKSVYIGNNKVLTATAWGGKMIVPSDDLGMSTDIMLYGLCETVLTKFFLKTLKPGNVFIDVGANVGHFSILAGYAVGENGKVLSYEPNPEMYQFLVDNISLNYLHEKNRVKAFQKAVFSKQDILNLQIYKRFKSCTSIYDRGSDWINNYQEETTNVKVESLPLDLHYSELNYIDLIKIDIEGAEYDAFLGMERLIQGDKVGKIVFEWNKPMLEERAELLVELMKKYEHEKNAKFFLINNDGDLVTCSIDFINSKEYLMSVVISF